MGSLISFTAVSAFCPLPDAMMKVGVALLLVSSFLQVAAAVDAECNHILVASESEIKVFKAELDAADDVKGKFEELAKKHSTCPSGKKGGSLGTFGPGQMVPEFDEVVFKTGTVGKVSDPVKTQFGYHLLLITRRGDEKMSSEHTCARNVDHRSAGVE